MTDTVGSALIRRHIGRRFAALRQRAGLTQDEAAIRLERGRATIGRIEDGDERVRFRDVDVRQMLEVFDAPQQEREVLLALTAETRNGRRKSWWHDYTATELPQWFGLYVSLEDSAETIRQYELELIPGLLQTRAYAEQIMSVPAGLLAEDEIRRRVSVRLERQTLLSRPRAPQLDVVLNEAALQRLAAADDDLGREQLRHLLDVSLRSNVILRVLPWSAGFHGGLGAGGGFCLLDFPADSLSHQQLEPPLAYLDSPTGAMYLTKPAEVNTYYLIWDDLMTRVLSPDDSRVAITAKLEGQPFRD
jgi:hypothetical protein